MSIGPNPVQLVDAVATILGAVPTAGVVVPDPMYEEDEREMIRFLRVDGTDTFDGWLIGVQAEEPETRRGADGANQYTRLFVTGILSVSAADGAVTSRPLFGAKIADAKDALRAQSDLGLGTTNVSVRHEGLYAPNGYPARDFREFAVHTAPMELRVYVTFC